uniref:Uncharacterized protein n=1 Tax=Arundo donax TaxID=35708 RepID=A0A0A9FZC5_ARUDO
MATMLDFFIALSILPVVCCSSSPVHSMLPIMITIFLFVGAID